MHYGKPFREMHPENKAAWWELVEEHKEDKEHETKVYKWNPNQPCESVPPNFLQKMGWTIRPMGKYWRTKN
jgi:hypothetical protein